MANRIRIDQSALTSLSAPNGRIMIGTSDAAELARKAKNALDWEVSGKEEIDSTLNSLITRLNRQESRAGSMGNVLATAGHLAESENGELASGAESIRRFIGSVGAVGAAAWGTAIADRSSEENGKTATESRGVLPDIMRKVLETGALGSFFGVSRGRSGGTTASDAEKKTWGLELNPGSLLTNGGQVLKDIKSQIDPDKIVKEFGNAGQFISAISSVFSAAGLAAKIDSATQARDILTDIVEDARNYKYLENIHGKAKATWYFAKKEFGFRTVGHASTVKNNPAARFVNNLKNKSSPFNLKDAFGSFTGANGVGAAVGAWTGVALTAVGNAKSNLEEQRQAQAEGKEFSNARVIAETATETAIDTLAKYALPAIVGAGLSLGGVVAAPVVVSLATQAVILGVNTGAKAWTGKTATEWASDFVVDTAEAVGKGAVSGAKAVSKWAGDTISTVGSGIRSGAKAVGSWAKDTASNISEGVKGIGSRISEDVKSVGSGILQGTKAVGSWFGKAAFA